MPKAGNRREEMMAAKQQTRVQERFWGRIGLPAPGDELYSALHKGFSFVVYSKLADLSGLDEKELAKVITPATLRRREKAGKFTLDESDRLYRFAKVLKAATDLYAGDEEAARRWLGEPSRGLGGRKPVDMLTTSAESESVLDLIGRLEHGVVA